MKNKSNERIIGVVGGVGPYAGLDLMKKILEETAVSTDTTVDQEHLTVINYSGPAHIMDRTQFLSREVDDNPAEAIFEQLLTLENAGAVVGGVPCNTAHAPRIFETLATMVDASDMNLKLLNMLTALSQHLQTYHPDIKRLGLLGTVGSYRAKVYEKMMEPDGFEIVVPNEELQMGIHTAIQHPEYGIKACGYGTETAVSMLMEAVDDLQKQGIDGIVLGCTELPLALTAATINGLPAIDPTRVLARALIHEAYPDKLKKWGEK